MPPFTAISRDENGVPLQGTYKTINAGVSGAVTSGTALQITTTSTACKRVDVVSAESNAGTVYVGGSTVKASTKTGVPLLSPGSSVGLFVNDVSSVYFDSTSTNDKVSFIYYA